MPSFYPQSYILRSGPPPRPYGAVPHNNGTHPPPYSPHSGALNTASVPGPAPHHTGGPSQRRTSMITRYWPAICLAVILFQTVLIICRSDTLAIFIDLKSAADRASREKLALMVERGRSAQEREMLEQQRVRSEDQRVRSKQERTKLEKERVKSEWERENWEQERENLEQERKRSKRESEMLEEQRVKSEQERIKSKRERENWEHERERWEQEREEMRRDRELWEKARENRVPYDAFWDAISPAPACSAYGKREYSSTLQNIPEGWTAIDACMNMPVEIKGVAVRRPYRCAFVEGSSHIYGYWMVDWDEPDCRPWWYNYQDAGCTSYKSGARRIEGELVGLIDKKDQDWRLMCASTPLIWNYITYKSPTHCEERNSDRMFGMWDVPDDSCL